MPPNKTALGLALGAAFLLGFAVSLLPRALDALLGKRKRTQAPFRQGPAPSTAEQGPAAFTSWPVDAIGASTAKPASTPKPVSPASAPEHASAGTSAEPSPFAFALKPDPFASGAEPTLVKCDLIPACLSTATRATHSCFFSLSTSASEPERQQEAGDAPAPTPPVVAPEPAAQFTAACFATEPAAAAGAEQDVSEDEEQVRSCLQACRTCHEPVSCSFDAPDCHQPVHSLFPHHEQAPLAPVAGILDVEASALSYSYRCWVLKLLGGTRLQRDEAGAGRCMTAQGQLQAVMPVSFSIDPLSSIPSSNALAFGSTDATEEEGGLAAVAEGGSAGSEAGPRTSSSCAFGSEQEGAGPGEEGDGLAELTFEPSSGQAGLRMLPRGISGLGEGGAAGCSWVLGGLEGGCGLCLPCSCHSEPEHP